METDHTVAMEMETDHDANAGASAMAWTGPASPPPPVVRDALSGVAAREGFVRPRFHVEPGSGAGEGYMSVLYRARIEEQQQQAEPPSSGRDPLFLMCKVTTPAQQGMPIMERAFAHEGCMYEEGLPAFEEVADLAEPLPWPRCHGVRVSGPPPHSVVLSDLRPLGFAMLADRSRGLDAAHCRHAVVALARFHGAGMALRHQRPQAFADLVQRLGGERPKLPDDLRNMFRAFIRAASITPDMLRDKYPEGSPVHTKLKKLFAEFADNFYDYFDADAEGGNCIVHADCHVNNVLFQYDQRGAVTGCRLLDFQSCRYGNPAPDLLAMLLACTEKRMRDAHWDDLMRGYHDELQATLRAAGVADPDAVYSWDRFQAQLRRGCKYALCKTPTLVYGLQVQADPEIVKEIQAVVKQATSGNVAGGAAVSFFTRDTSAVKQRFGDIVQDLLDWGWL